MVRFSDIIRGKDKKDEEKKQPEAPRREGGFRLSDSRLYNARNVDTSVKKEGLSRRAGIIETGNYYSAFIERAREIGRIVKSDMNISPASILADMHAIIEKDIIDSLYEYAISVKNESWDISTHTVNVMFTSLKLGKGMKYDIKMLMRLGLAAFLENVGMYKMPEDILEAKGKLSEDEKNLIKKHSETSYKILSNLGERYEWLAETALSIHERSDGSGYPFGLRGNDIPELSSIIGLIDIYIAMINNRPYRDKFIQTDAIKYIVEAGKGKFPSRIIKIFLDQISLFPVNSCVRLNNGSICRVISTDRRHPLSPVVEILYDGEGRELDDRQQINLLDNPLLYINHSINPDDLKD